MSPDSFLTPLDVRYLDGTDWEVLSEFVYESPRMMLRIPKGFTTDFGSIPRFFWRVLSPTDRHLGKPAVVHDYLYRNPWFDIDRAGADYELREAMKCLGAPWWKHTMVYRGVRLGGGRAFKARVIGV